jgi:hypothetical protein
MELDFHFFVCRNEVTLKKEGKYFTDRTPILDELSVTCFLRHFRSLCLNLITRQLLIIAKEKKIKLGKNCFGTSCAEVEELNLLRHLFLSFTLSFSSTLLAGFFNPAQEKGDLNFGAFVINFPSSSTWI